MKTYGVRATAKMVAGLAGLLWTAGVSTPLRASNLDPLDITIVEESGRGYVEPAGRAIVIAIRPMRLFVRIRNTSDADLLVRIHPEKAYSIELKDESGRISTVKRKKKGEAAGDDVRVNLKQGAERIIRMDINPDTWEGIPDLTPGKESKYTARVIYKNADGRHFSSPPYALTIRILE